MDLQHNTHRIPVIRHPKPETLGCAVIDAAGREIPITEEMIQKACRELEPQLDKPTPQN
ncbi:multifunctional fatty acid oxidation complex subunit alpha [Pseudomonas agarici]|uniref:Multifunctional fatty acid oxidation complex subunit alpha n=1 Tax=Pseudomonas agarici TaxID=46677 RepID=A0A0X1T0Y3_PSEAA|nr:PA1571 family protein [Pseudomonas agarici]AMB85724.1 multifunctional fatty acid oxidation complex subunit alpha [Pseudomonas agarici]NWB90988.1 hypothetical protein [Pseudomonas agarici]NWC09648.1 hypothetical protein [Pseudomonas agarici]SEL21106.1 hypothetical protein SAMN05216604_11332 [Pseudomonas agarici]